VGHVQFLELVPRDFKKFTSCAKSNPNVKDDQGSSAIFDGTNIQPESVGNSFF
jgi:hypothetical protein